MKWAFWVNFILFVTIQTVDMALTEHYIGNKWEHETFPIMSMMIKEIGIHPALWVCRLTSYVFLFGCLRLRDKTWVTDLMTVLNICYWTAMTSWLFTLKLVEWPLPLISITA